MTIYDVMHRVTVDEMATWMAYFKWVDDERRRQQEKARRQM